MEVTVQDPFKVIHSLTDSMGRLEGRVRREALLGIEELAEQGISTAWINRSQCLWRGTDRGRGYEHDPEDKGRTAGEVSAHFGSDCVCVTFM